MSDGGTGGDRGSDGGQGVSEHPVDRLIRELIGTGRQATAGEVERIVEHLATAPFDGRVVSVPCRYRGLTYQGRTLTDRERSLFLHLVQRVVEDEQWADGTTEGRYLADLWDAVREPTARLLLYRRRGGPVAAVLAPDTVPPPRRGLEAQPLVYVVYSADRGRIISGYQASEVETISIPGDALWLS